jgi:hypothetical protein
MPDSPSWRDLASLEDVNLFSIEDATLRVAHVPWETVQLEPPLFLE